MKAVRMTITNANTSVILGWPTKLEISSSEKFKKLHPLMSKKRRYDISGAIKYHGDSHLITFAPTGSGKGVSVIIPNLLHFTGSVIVIDPKGENFAITARYRRNKLKQKIFLLDPFHSIADELLEKYQVKREKLNPLDLCLVSNTALENDVQMIANMLAGSESLGDDPFWDISAKKLISGLLAHEIDMSKKENRSPKFSKVVDYLFGDDPILNMATMLDEQQPSKFVMSSIGGGFLSFPELTRGSILAVAQSYLSMLLSTELLEWLDVSTINLGDIQDGEKYTLYLVIPPSKLDSHSSLLATWIGVLMLTIMERKQVPEQKTLFMLDECANLGNLDVLKKAVTLLRGYGLQVWMFFQDLAQLQSLYTTDYLTMINNCGVLQAFGIHRMSAAQPLTRLIGKYKASDLQGMDRTQQVLSKSPGKPRICRLMKYYEDPVFFGCYDDNPLRAATEILNINPQEIVRIRKRRFN